MTVGCCRHGVVTALSSRRRVARDRTTINGAVLPSPSPDRRRRPEKRRRVYRRPPESDGGAGAMGPFSDEGGACGSGTCHVGPGGRALTLTAPWAHPPAASDREGFDACGEENRGKHPTREGDDCQAWWL